MPRGTPDGPVVARKFDSMDLRLVNSEAVAHTPQPHIGEAYVGIKHSISTMYRGAALMRRRRFIFVSPRVLPRSGLLPGVCADMVFVPRRGSLRRTCIPLVYAEMPSGQQVMVAPRPWVGTTPWYQPTANENIAPPAHQMPSGLIRHGLKLIVLY